MRQSKKRSRKTPDLSKKYADELKAWFNSYSEPAKLPVRSFWDYLLDVHSFPDQVELRRVYNGQAGFEQDARNMHKYARNVICGMASENERSDS